MDRALIALMCASHRSDAGKLQKMRSRANGVMAGHDLLSRPLVFFVHTLDDRGVARAIKPIVSELAERGLPVVVICATRRQSEVLPLPANVPVVDLGIRGGTMLAIPRLAQELRRRRPAVIFAHGPGPNRASVIARLLARVPTSVVLVEHTHVTTWTATTHSHLGRHLRRSMERLLYKRADAVAGVSPGVIDDLRRRIPGAEHKLRLLPNPAPSNLAQRCGPVTKGAHCADVFAAGPTICCVANIVRRKGQMMVVEALALVRQAIPGARLVFVGRPDDRRYFEELRGAIQRLELEDAVCWAGFQHDALPYIASSAVLVSASFVEGFGLTLIEAMACGTPVVATDCPSGPTFVLENGRYGLLVPVGDISALALAVTRVLSDDALAKRLSEVGRLRAAMFDLDHAVDGYLQLAREVSPTNHSTTS